MSSNNKVMEVLDRHVELAMWAEHDVAPAFWLSYLKGQDDPHLSNHDILGPDSGSANDNDVAELYAESAAQMMGLAETYYVTDDICDVIEESAGTIPREPLRAHMIPSRIGWIEFGRELLLGVDEDDEPWGVAGVAWRVEDDVTNLESMRGGIRWKDASGNSFIGPGITIIWWRDLRWAEESNKYPPDALAMLPWAAPGQVTGWAFDIPWDPEHRDSSYTLDETGELQRKILLTTFNLLMDELVRVAKERPARGAVRRASRVLKSPDYGDVNVVELRKVRLVGYEPPDPDDEADPVHWTHRWIVRGHWRTIHRNTAKERHVWIRKHVKGPDGKPIIVKDRLNLLKR